MRGISRSSFNVGVKVYDSDWFIKYKLSYAEAAKTLKDWGCSFVLAQSKYLPMPDSAVKSEAGPDSSDRYAQLSDRAFRDALSAEGVDYWATVCMFFDPYEIEKNPELRPVGSDGEPMEMVDWYIGIAPAQEVFVKQRVDQIVNAVKALEPKGVFLSFMRWPGFWELWKPESAKLEFPEYCFSAHVLGKFSEDLSIEIPAGETKFQADFIFSNHRATWVEWKCEQVLQVIRNLKEKIREIDPDIQIMLNTLPFGNADYGNAQKSYFGQDIERLNQVVDVFEVMTYHQILNRPVEWIPRIGKEIKERTGKKTYCTIQVKPHYIDGIHKGYMRNEAISVGEFDHTVRLVEEHDLDGVVIFVWSDLLEEMLLRNNSAHIQALQSVKSARELKQD
ncbi:hypothetical protein ACFLYP_02340 [Chloroflexota bacterium]